MPNGQIKQLEWHLSDESGLDVNSFRFGNAAMDIPIAGNWNGSINVLC